MDLATTIKEFIRLNLTIILQILITLGVALIAIRLLKGFVRQMEKRLTREDIDQQQRPRLLTLLHTGAITVRAIILITATLIILATLGINLAPLLASVGIAGLAISLGAQTLIKDYIGGMLILVENQFNVGDEIQLGDVDGLGTLIGIVEKMTLRYTTLRNFQGKVFIIPNGDVRILSNNNRDWNRAIVDINLAFDTDTNQAIQVLQTALGDAMQDETIHPYMLEDPVILGWNSISEWAVQVRIQVKTAPGKQNEVAAVIRRLALARLQEAKLKVALPPTYMRQGA
jgi:small-conductance mechanosensitive channel